MAEKFVKGEKLSPDKVAHQLLPILAMWGMSRATARNAANQLALLLDHMSDAEYESASKGMRIKGSLPNHAAQQKAN